MYKQSLTREARFHMNLFKGQRCCSGINCSSCFYVQHQHSNHLEKGCQECVLIYISLLPQVCDTFLKYGLPLVVMPPPGVFYPALFATDPVSVDRLAFIMYRWGLFHTQFPVHYYDNFLRTS